MTTTTEFSDLAVKLSDAALKARDHGDDVHAIFFATKAAECLQLARALGWKPEPIDKPPADGRP